MRLVTSSLFGTASALSSVCFDNTQAVDTENFKATEEWLFNVVVTILIAYGKIHLLGDEDYRPYLTSAYVEAMSAEPTKVHLIQSF